MDNIAFHKGDTIKTFIENKGAKYLFLPPYSPFLNPIENLFSKLKNSVKSKSPNNETELFEYLEDSSSDINSDDCKNYFSI